MVAVLSIQSYTPNAYTRDDLDTLQSLADYCGGALERLQMQEALLEEQHLFDALLKSTSDIIYFKDSASRFIRISRAQCLRFGLEDPEQAFVSKRSRTSIGAAIFRSRSTGIHYMENAQIESVSRVRCFLTSSHRSKLEISSCRGTLQVP